MGGPEGPPFSLLSTKRLQNVENVQMWGFLISCQRSHELEVQGVECGGAAHFEGGTSRVDVLYSIGADL